MQTFDLITTKLESIHPSSYEDHQIPEIQFNSLFTGDLPLCQVLKAIPEVFSREAPDSERLWRYAFYTRLFV